jgi:N-acetylglucosamine-6-phosphate deacetylase
MSNGTQSAATEPLRQGAGQGETWLLPDRLFDGRGLRSAAALVVRNGRVDRIAPANDAPPDHQVIGGVLSPGFIDLQVNGGGGILLNTSPDIAGMTAIAAAHRGLGTAGILPTVITDGPEVLARVVDAAIAAKGQPGILGLHIEGPHISQVRRGTHAARHVRPMEQATFEHLERLHKAGLKVMITVAPEAVTPGEVARISETGVVVSLGHSDADADTTREYLAAGARCFTHLFNAMSPMLNRAPGVVGAAINSDAYAGIIADGIHVADEMIGLAIRARPVPDRMFLVSDAMPTVGGPDRFDLYGATLRLENGRLVNSEGSLAGAHLSQAEGLWRLVNVLGIDPDAALRMVVSIPARLMGLDELASPVGRPLRDIARLSSDLRFRGWLAD